MEEGLLPLHHDLTGVWMVDQDRSQLMDSIYNAMNVSWWSRFLITGGNATIVHTPHIYRCSEPRVFGKHTVDFALTVKQAADLPNPAIATTTTTTNTSTSNASSPPAQQRGIARNSGNGRLTIDTNYGKELSTHEERWLESRLFMIQTLTVKRTGEPAVTVTRYWRRVETRAQQRVGDAAWIVSGIPLGHLPTPPLGTNTNPSTTDDVAASAKWAVMDHDDIANHDAVAPVTNNTVTIQVGHSTPVSQSVLAAAAAGRPGYQMAPQIHQAHAPCGPPCRCPKSAKQSFIRKICD